VSVPDAKLPVGILAPGPDCAIGPQRHVEVGDNAVVARRDCHHIVQSTYGGRCGAAVLAAAPAQLPVRIVAPGPHRAVPSQGQAAAATCGDGGDAGDTLYHDRHHTARCGEVPAFVAAGLLG